MSACQGYQDASGAFFIAVDTAKCNGCGDCAGACPEGAFEIVDEDPNDPPRDVAAAAIAVAKARKLNYECNPCKPSANRPTLPCVEACTLNAISHSWLPVRIF